MTTDVTNTDVSQNPLLDFSGLPRFDAIKAEHVTPAIDHLLEKSYAVVASLEAPTDQVTWDNFVARNCWAARGAWSAI
jgi:oligopeptidase A